MHVFGIDITSSALILGAISGLAYGMLAMGLILVYRATRIINFAYGEIGAFCALIFLKLVLDEGWAYLPALAVAALTGLAVGAFWEKAVIEPLFNRPRVVLLISTVGIALVMSSGQAIIGGTGRNVSYPEAFHARWDLGGTVLTGADIALLIFVPVVSLALALLWRSPVGLAIRATSENAEAARLSGIRIQRVSLFVFALAGLLGAVTFVLVNPVRAGSTGAAAVALGPSLLVRALIAALIGRMWSMPMAMVGGIGLGIVEAVVLANATEPGLIDLVLLVALVVLLLSRRYVHDDDAESSMLSPTVPPISGPLLADARVRAVSWLPYAPIVAFIAFAPFVLTRSADQFTLAQIAIYALAGVSVVLVTGWGGQLSLAQFAFVGLGALLTARLTADGFGFVAATLLSIGIGVIVATALGLPASRARGIQLALVTLAFSVACSSWLFTGDLLMRGESEVSLTRPKILGVDFADQRSYALLCIGVFVVVAGLITSFRRTGFGRLIVAVRDNESASAAMTVSPTVVKVSTFALAGGVATLAGSLYGGLLQSFGEATFPPVLSLSLLTVVVIGGISSVWGAYLGALAVVGGAAWLNPVFSSILPNQTALASLLAGVGLVVILIKQPSGIAGDLLALRRRIVERAAARWEPAAAAEPRDVAPRGLRLELITPSGVPPAAGVRPLQTVDLSVSFGGIRANDSVSLHVEPGEIVGLLGSNGAGKSTLINAISGFQKIESGSVRLFGEDVTTMSPDRRAQYGVARVFQNGLLFPGLTVRETLMLGSEPIEPSGFGASLLALPNAIEREWAKADQAVEFAQALGLERYLDTLVSSLSMGTRRVVELACVAAASPGLILLDEPTSGIAQREAEAFGGFIRDLRSFLHASILIIEHDIPLLMAICDRVYALDAGRVIAEGPPSEVRNDPRVIAAYLGTDDRALTRSLHVEPENVAHNQPGGGA